jgi:hypothetical protein
MTSLTWDQVCAWRLVRHHLVEAQPRERLVDLVAGVCGVQAQVMSAAELSVAVRADGVTPDDVRAALWERRELVKLWCMRGTLHLLPAAELPLYVSALRARNNFLSPAWLKYMKLTAAEVEAMIAAIGDALDGRSLTREELADEVARRTAPHLREHFLSGWGGLLKPATYRGVLCFGPNRGRNVTFVRPDQWVTGWRTIETDEALTAVAHRYLAAYGPTTHVDFAQWWAMGTGPARRVFQSLGDELAQVEVEGVRCWALAADVAAMREQPPTGSVRLLPHFDAYTIGFRPREVIVPDGFLPRVSRTAGWISPVVLIDGRVAGVWDYRRARDAVEVTVEPFVTLSARQKTRIEAEADRLGGMLGVEARVSFDGVPPAQSRGRIAS